MAWDVDTLAPWGLKVASWLKAWWDKRAQAPSPRLVVIGTVTHGLPAARIRAEVKPPWQRWYQPDVETFLEWVWLGPIYCSGCQGRLIPWGISDDQVQGVRCPHCGRHTSEEEVQRLELLPASEIRRHYDAYWTRYQQATYTWLDRGIVRLRAGPHRGEEAP
jgi:hypothetical protein